jgi:tetratricopeptide (TPR) repeat protein
LERDPNYLAAHYNRGLVYRILGRWDEAIAAFSEVIRIDPHYARAYQNRAVAYSQKGDHAQAAADLEKAKQLGISL